MSQQNRGQGFQNWDKEELREVARKGGEHSHGGGRRSSQDRDEGSSGRGGQQGGQQGGNTENRGFASMDPQKQENIASKGGLTAQAHRHGYENVEEYEKAKERGQVEFSKGQSGGQSGGRE